VEVQFAIRTRQSERDQLASHLVATVSYLWFQALVSILLGSMLSASLLAGSRTSLSRAVARARGAPPVARRVNVIPIDRRACPSPS
jgi:hypothetical protein